MTDINKQIEEDAREYANNNDLCPTLDGYEEINSQHKSDILHAYSNGYNACLHSSRWRKVSEGMPPIDDAGVSINVLINVRLKSNNQDLTCVIEGFYDFDIEEWFLLIPLPKKYKIEILSWKPID